MSVESPSVLIVDDDGIVAASIAELLARDGYRTATAGSGEKAYSSHYPEQREGSPSRQNRLLRLRGIHYPTRQPETRFFA